MNELLYAIGYCTTKWPSAAYIEINAFVCAADWPESVCVGMQFRGTLCTVWSWVCEVVHAPYFVPKRRRYFMLINTLYKKLYTHSNWPTDQPTVRPTDRPTSAIRCGTAPRAEADISRSAKRSSAVFCVHAAMISALLLYGCIKPYFTFPFRCCCCCCVIASGVLRVGLTA